MFEKKYVMSQEENIFWAKRNLVDYIWKSANLEGIGVTFPETQTIVEGISIQGKSIDDINSIVQLKHGWQMVFESINEELDLAYIKKLHLIIGKMTVINSGTLRMDEVRIAGSSYIPPIPTEALAEKKIREILSSGREWTEIALNLMLYLTKSQLFYDGNKRIAMLAANKLLIQHGCGVLSVSQDQLEKFFTLLISYYEDEAQADALKKFLYENCLDGFRGKVSD
ncbi:Fic family protein [Mordavella massiliensis]|uniref:Fic family protein n=1 Tax=Mordavella massiliensis TaxID=1871024 RepID=A0A939BG54_9CLOT|nr:Fic family protein [Mordavella massiliensis]MBM6947665.1 Fic family protein [Mordavella massiliensis]